MQRQPSPTEHARCAVINMTVSQHLREDHSRGTDTKRQLLPASSTLHAVLSARPPSPTIARTLLSMIKSTGPLLDPGAGKTLSSALRMEMVV
ncbi:MAG: hypothetical protein ACJAQ3_003430 [Planctomycetota bacterium]|jgi:hypothetical protein